jgi:hypothetical protein
MIGQLKESTEKLNTEYTNLILYGSDKTLPESAVTHARTLVDRATTSEQTQLKTNGKASSLT